MHVRFDNLVRVLTPTLALFWASQASAQVPTNIALDGYQPAPAGDAMLAIPDGSVPDVFRLNGGILTSYARSPLILRRHVGERSAEVGRVVTHQMVMHVLASADFRGFKLEIDAPFTVSQAGKSPPLYGSPATSPSEAAVNDLRLGLRASLLRQRGLAPGAALGFTVWLPTGNDDQFAGSGKTRYAPSLHVGADYEHVIWRAVVARRFQHEADNLRGMLGSDVFFGAGVAGRLGPVQLGPELFGSTAANGEIDAFNADSTQLELLLSGRARLGPVVFSAGGGPGLTRGIGTPSVRIVAGAGYSPEPEYFEPEGPELRRPSVPPSEDVDRDSKGQPAGPGPSRVGAAVEGTKKGGTPALAPAVSADLDGDGVPDAIDQCPKVVGESSPQARRPGCPPDADGDGILDMDDRCAAEKGVQSRKAERNGCPPDSDGDGIVDPKDACPREKGPSAQDPKASGCPTAVRITGTQIVIMQKVAFPTGGNQIDPSSHALLSQVAQVLKEHPEIVRVAVDGHTDNVGLAARNLALSRRRALAVVRWLVDNGVDERRLEARGFGPRQPIADNGSEEGRAKNRRVEFQILKRSEKGKAGWKDGAVDE